MKSMFKLEFKTKNAAFGEDEFEKADEIGRILREIADKIDKDHCKWGKIRDINGNKVGGWEIT